MNLPEGARVTYREMLRRPPRPAVPEDYRSIASVHRAVRYPQQQQQQQQASNLAAPESAAAIPSVYLHREVNPTHAYALTGRSIELSHHHPEWGHVRFGIVLERRDSSTGFVPPTSASEVKHVAIKELRKSVFLDALDRGGPNDPYKEVALLQELGDNVHVLQLLEALEDDEFLYIVTPRGLGTLLDIIPWHTRQSLQADRVRAIFRQLLDILLYLERHSVCHRDLSPDNFLFLSESNLVVFDFGLSLRIPVDAQSGRRHLMQGQGRFGTFPYMSPEVFQLHPYDGVFSDLWAVAVNLFNLLTNQVLYDAPVVEDPSFMYFILAGGLAPGPRNDRAEQVLRMVMGGAGGNNLLSRIQSAQSLDETAAALLEKLLHIDPRERWSLAQALDSDFLNS
jgi:serine/threonine protein kinase